MIEEVRFLRDEMANMVWAIEHTTENGLALPWLGHERVLTKEQEDQAQQSDAPLKYLIQTSVPENWIPFVPVRIDPSRSEVALERAAMLRPVEGGNLEPIRPVGGILQPSELADPSVYRVREEEITRTGVRLSRLVRRTRWIDGSTHIWIVRRRRAGGGEGYSGLRFDVAMRTKSPEG